MKAKITKQLFTRLWTQGIPVADIIKTLNISRRTTCNWRAALKLPRRRKA
jgi:hypothetical protein